MSTTDAERSAQYRSCYNNFAEHLLNAYNPNMVHPLATYRWSDADWFAFIDMIADFGFNIFEFWLVPKLFSRPGIAEPFGHEFARQINAVIDYAATRGLRIKMITALSTVGEDWHTHCPNVPAEWDECRMLWHEWTKRLPGLGIVGIFPGDPGGCSRNGCTAETFVDRACDIAAIIKRNLPRAEIELGTWGNPFFGWGSIQGPPDWRGAFIPSIQHTAWIFDAKRADAAMTHLLRRLADFPADTIVAINLAFNPDSDPDAANGAQDARPWAREIAKQRPIVTWDFSLTEGENAIIPHYRFDRLFAQRRREREAAPYRGGICFTMTPKLNQLSLFQAAQSFLDPDADHRALTTRFYRRLFGRDVPDLTDALPLFEIIPDWGNYNRIDISRREFHARMTRAADLLADLKGSVNTSIPFHPTPDLYHQELEFFFRLFADLSADNPDFPALHKRYWNRVYSIYDHLPPHVDPRPRHATDNLINFFNPAAHGNRKPTPGKWTD